MSTQDEVNMELQILAATDWNKFCDLTGFDATSYIICKHRKKGKSLQQIANMMGTTKRVVELACKKCEK